MTDRRMFEDERIEYEERAAIAEFEGGLIQHEAERLAMICAAAQLLLPQRVNQCRTNQSTNWRRRGREAPVAARVPCGGAGSPASSRFVICIPVRFWAGKNAPGLPSE